MGRTRIPFTLEDFITESNAIEGIERAPLISEIEAHKEFLALKDNPTVADLEKFVQTVAKASLRDKKGMDVIVGSHIPIYGGPKVRQMLEEILAKDSGPRYTLNPKAYELHREYEWLHPFTDGNGRSGRVLWLWHMGGDAPLGFLRTWYYQSLRGE